MPTVLLVDDDSLARLGMHAALDSETDIAVVGEASDGVEAVQAVREVRPEIVIMDIQMPRLDGVAATREIRALPEAPYVLVITAFNVTDNVVAAIDAGASGFLLKDSTRTQLVAAVRAVANGDPVLAPASVKLLFEQVEAARRDKHGALTRLAGLTPRELDVLALLSEGKTNAEIARELFIGDATVKSTVSHLLERIGVENRTQAAILAHRAGLSPGDRR